MASGADLDVVASSALRKHILIDELAAFIVFFGVVPDKFGVHVSLPADPKLILL